MNGLRSFASEVAGLFVEDPLFALAIAVVVLVAFVASANGYVDPGVRGIALFFALAIVLVMSVARAAAPRR